MSEHPFTLDQIRYQAQDQALAFLLASIVYFKEQGCSPLPFIASVGNTLAPRWKDLQGFGAHVVMEHLALHVVALGGHIVAMTGDDVLSCATLSHIPSTEILKSFALSRDDADVIWDVFQPIAASLYLWYAWSREQDEVTFKLSRTRLPIV
ncbi:hypothetical protein [Ktedonospora formicarum]|uniref:Uncharacterized protein n=1 Tax=Ktedonospora formicarum TaxID=2778364 RepID=A0A8J3HSC5_9CHLR|nr:hypothetical protein [Ktedonospora formicarum]GHO42381.1 hypothetical protein KSX_05440 [Ktedonospora formicarum]